MDMVEVESLLSDAGYQFDPSTGRYRAVAGAVDGEVEHESEFIADELGIPLEDLQLWEQEQIDGTEEA